MVVTVALFGGLTSAAEAQAPRGVQLNPDRSRVEGSSERPRFNAVFYNLNSLSTEAETVLIDLELYDFSGAKIAQAFFDNQTFGSAVTKSYALELDRDLEPGNYRFAVGVFDPGWERLREWHHAAAVVAVGETPTGTLEVVSHGQGWVEVRARDDFFGVVDLELYQAHPTENDLTGKVSQRAWESERLRAGETKRYQLSPLFLSPGAGPYTLKLGVFKPFWSELLEWYDNIETWEVAH